MMEYSTQTSKLCMDMMSKVKNRRGGRVGVAGINNLQWTAEIKDQK